MGGSKKVQRGGVEVPQGFEIVLDARLGESSLNEHEERLGFGFGSGRHNQAFGVGISDGGLKVSQFSIQDFLNRRNKRERWNPQRGRWHDKSSF